MTSATLAVRLAQYAALLPLFGLAAFAVYAPRAAAFLLRGRGIVLLAGAGLIATLASIFVLAATMAGDATGASDPATLWAVISDTGAGRAWAARVFALAAAMAVARTASPFPLLVASGMAAASLAWGGHGAADSGAFGAVHLAPDIVHILAAGVWLGALIAFVRLIFQAGDSRAATAAALTKFSGLGSILVAALVGSGVINSLNMVAWRPLPVLTTSPWGLLLIVKLTLFAAMIGMAAMNRFVLTPRLRTDLDGGATARLHGLRLSLLVETGLALAVVAVVSVLGTLVPPASA